MFWSSPPSNLVLPSDEIHLWRADLNLSPEQLELRQNILSEDEQLRAKRFHFERDRQHFIAARGLLRAILGRYLNREPSQLEFCYSPKGKPALANLDCSVKVEFNLSHSNGIALYGVTRDRSIGIDLEYIRPLPNANQLAQRFFSLQEYAVIASLPANLQQIAFFNGWTRKEAYLKAIGEGVGGLRGVEVSLTPGEPPAILGLSGKASPKDWSLYNLALYPGYAGALAVEAQNLQLRYFEA
jgi:4'-phosphopantetheinyl transferase